MTRTTNNTMPAGTMSGTPQILLAHHLKQLKLPTVLREYEKVGRECAESGVDHPRYLLRLIELELIDRERRTVERRIRAARFPAVKSFDTFDFTAIPGLNKMLVLASISCGATTSLRSATAGPARRMSRWRWDLLPARKASPSRSQLLPHWSVSFWRHATNDGCSSYSAIWHRQNCSLSMNSAMSHCHRQVRSFCSRPSLNAMSEVRRS
jgi:hypothetical protein